MIKYIKNPNLPTEKVKCVLVDNRISPTSVENLKKEGIEVIFTKNIDNLYDAVKSHPDMQIHHLGENNFICEPTVFDYYKKILPDADIISGKTELNEKYPFDIAYNAAWVGNYVFHNFSYTDSILYEYYQALNLKLINVKQGYSKCSIAVINDNAIITSDLKVAQICENYNIDVLYVNPEDIRLNTLSNGFIGGICGKIDIDILAVNGNIQKLKSYDKIKTFLDKYCIKTINLNDEIPYDVGSIIPIF